MPEVGSILAAIARTRELEGRNQSRAALDIGRNAERWAGELGRTDLVAKARLRQAFSYFNLSRQLEAVEVARASLPCFLEVGDALGEATALAMVALGLTGSGALDEGAEALISATIAVERIETETIDLVFALDCVSDAHATLGAFNLAVPLIERSRRIAAREGAIERTMWVEYSSAYLQWRYGESLAPRNPTESREHHELALAAARESARIAAELGNPDMAALALLFQGLALVSLGELEPGVEALTTADAAGVGVDSPNETGLVALGLGRAYAKRGDHRLARVQLDRAVESFAGASFQESLALALEERSRCALAVEDHASVITDLQRLVDLRDRQHAAQILRRINTVEAQIALRRAEEQRAALVELASRDALTELYNRRGFDAAASTLALARTDYAVAVIDIDRFKLINDHHSHLVGDRVLQRLARILQAQARATDIVCRYAGDEFVLLLPKTSLAHARMLGERIRSAVLTADWTIDDAVPTVTVSVGVAVGRGEVDGVLAVADGNLYRAKTAGRNLVVSDSETQLAA